MAEKPIDPIFDGIVEEDVLEKEIDIFFESDDPEKQSLSETDKPKEAADIVKELTPEPTKEGITSLFISWLGSFFDITRFRPLFDVTQEDVLKRVKHSLWPF
jgi:hypothetical protein